MNPNDASWQLQPPGDGTRWFLLLLGVVLPLAITAGALVFALQSNDANLRLIDNSRPLTISVSLAAVAAVSLLLTWLLIRAFNRHRLTLDAHSLDIATTFYRRRLPLADLRLDQARVVNLDERTELKPLFKTNGTSLPGFNSGWFRLRNREKALVAVAGGKRVVWIPTRADYSLLLQPRNAQALLDELRRLADAPAQG